MDIVYTVKECVECEELTYSLRSLVNLPHDRVFIVGSCPININREKVIFLSTLQRSSKYINTTNNLKVACQNKDISEEFILMNDDFFILKPIKDTKAELNLYAGTLEECAKNIRARNGAETMYTVSMRQTDTYLKDLGISTPLSYELHIPMVLEKNKLLKLFSLPYLGEAQLVHKRSLYGNLYLKDSTLTKDVKIYRNLSIPYTIDKFLSTEDNSWPLVKADMNKRFSNKSIYEI